MAGVADADDAAVALAEDFWKRFCGAVCSAIYRAAAEVGDRVAAGAVAAASVEADSAVAAVVVLAAVLVVETALVEVAQVAVGKSSVGSGQ